MFIAHNTALDCCVCTMVSLYIEFILIRTFMAFCNFVVQILFLDCVHVLSHLTAIHRPDLSRLLFLKFLLTVFCVSFIT